MFLFGFHSIQQAEMGAAMDALEKCKICGQQRIQSLFPCSLVRQGADFVGDKSWTEHTC